MQRLLSLQAVACRDELSGAASAPTMQLLPRTDMRNQKALRPMRSCEAGGRFWGSRVEGPKCSETLLSNMRSEAARSLGVQLLHWACSYCEERKPRAEFSAWQATRSHAQDGTQQCNTCVSLALVCRVARRANQRVLRVRHRLKREREQTIVEDVRRDIAAITDRRAKTSAGNTWRDGVTGEGRSKRRSRRARASGKWRGRHAQVASRVRSPREHGRHIPLHVPVL